MENAVYAPNRWQTLQEGKTLRTRLQRLKKELADCKSLANYKRIEKEVAVIEKSIQHVKRN